MATENPRVWFKSISLENVRSFGTKQTINFSDKEGNAARWNVILGDNGTGKTTVLKGLLVIVQDQKSIIETGVNFNELWRFDKEDVGIEICGIVSSGNEDLATGFTTKKWLKNKKSYDHSEFRLTRSYEIDINIFAYNAARRISTSAISEKRTNQITGFYYEKTELVNAEEWLGRVDN